MGNLQIKSLVLCLFMFCFICGLPSQAATITELQAQISSLITQVTTLQSQLILMQEATSTSSSCIGITFSRPLKQGSYGNDVKCLQALLNQSPDTRISLRGPGSLGLETYYFGYLTKLAVIKFQNKYAQEILAPIKLIYGTGIIGAGTRTKLNAIISVSTPVVPVQTPTIPSAPLPTALNTVPIPTSSVTPTQTPITTQTPISTPIPTPTPTSTPTSSTDMMRGTCIIAQRYYPERVDWQGLANKGINNVYVCTFPLEGSWERAIIPNFINYADKYGIKVWAWTSMSSRPPSYGTSTYDFYLYNAQWKADNMAMIKKLVADNPKLGGFIWDDFGVWATTTITEQQTQALVGWARDTRDAIKSVNPNVKFGIFSELQADKRTPHYRLAEYLDYDVPCIYKWWDNQDSRMIASQTQAIKEAVAGKCLVAPIITTYQSDFPPDHTIHTVPEMTADIKLVMQNGGDGFNLYEYSYLPDMDFHISAGQ